MKNFFATLNLRKLFPGDLGIWAVFIVLSLFSLLEVYTSSSRMTFGKGDFYGPAISHGAFLFGGFALAWVASWVPYKAHRLLSFFILGFGIFALIYALIAGSELNDTHRWAKLAGISFQPSEVAKLGLVMFAAHLFAEKRDAETGIMTVRGFWWVVSLTVIICALIISENMSTALLIGSTMVLMTWVAQPPKKQFYLSCALVFCFAGAGMLFLEKVPKETAQSIAKWEIAGATPFHRLETWVNRIQGGIEKPDDPSQYDLRKDIQETHAKIAVATSGIFWGTGIGQSAQSDYLPHAYSDFIYAIVIEEGGIIMGGLVMMAYLAILVLSWLIARRCKFRYPCYVTMGLALMLVSQALYNMGVAVGLLPVTGQPLPLMSKGGTSIIITSYYIGVILSVSHTAKRKDDDKKIPLEIVNTQETK